MSLARKKPQRANNQQNLVLSDYWVYVNSGLTKELISVSSMFLKNSFMHCEFSIALESATSLNIADL
ncbi:hypothetical protein AYI70_g1563 [Smittium culicis]|uniref:Uncharacterized protein n=1 Tax=Smittium culicis TaxID=133412 RepID=A0A1R1YC37_9FUNG|nr:hypothetical protein AYI70_g1563 [Smittium culicis]